MTRQPTAIKHPVHCHGTCLRRPKVPIKYPFDAQDFFGLKYFDMPGALLQPLDDVGCER